MRAHIRTSGAALWTIAAGGLLGAGTADAQDVEAGFALEEVTVTAQKRAENLQDVPLAVTAVTGDALQNSQFTNLNDLQFLAPTIQYTGGSSPSYQIRGVGTNTFDFAIENSVGVQLDGVPQLLPRSTFMNSLVDVERIEVLRGPQGTLFGKNTSAGVMTVATNAPRFDGWSNRARVSRGSYEELEVSDVLNVPLSESLALRTSLSYRDRDGYVRNLFTNRDIYGRRDYAANAKLLWKASDRVSALLIADYQKHDDDGYYVWTIRTLGTPLALGSPPILYVPRDYVAQTVATYGIPFGPDNLSGAWNSPIYNKTRTTGVTLQLDADLENFSIVSISGFRNGKYDGSMDSDSSPQPFYERNLFLLDGKQITQELRIASSGARRFDYVAGVFYSRYTVDARTLQTGTFGIVPATDPNRVTSSADGGARDFDVDNSNLALFGQGTVHLSDTWRAIVGARASRDEVDSRTQVTAVAGVCHRTYATTGACHPTPTANGAALIPQAGLSPSRTGWSGKLGLQHDFSEGVMAYATVSRGYKGVSVNNVNGASTVVEPETSLNAEVGLKAELFERRLSVNLAAYHTRFNDFQAQTLFVINGVNQYSIGNAGGLTIKGVEAELAWRAAESLTLSSSLIYNDARFTDFVTQCYPLQTAAQGCQPGTPTRFQAKGYPLNNAPKWAATANVRHELPLGDSWRLASNVNAAYKDDVYYQVGNPATIQPAYTLVNASIGVESTSGRWGVTVFARNLFDTHYTSLINPLIGTVGGYHNRPAENSVRTVGVALDMRFGAE